MFVISMNLIFSVLVVVMFYCIVDVYIIYMKFIFFLIGERLLVIVVLFDWNNVR